MTFRSVALSILLASVSGAAPAADPQPREPTSKWVVDFAESQCVASRNYGTAEEPLILALKAPPLGSVVELAVLREGRGGRYAQQVEGHFALDDREPLPASMLVFAAGEPKRRIVRFVLPLDAFADARKASAFHISAGGELDEKFAISQLDSLMSVIDECVADLRQVWNVVEGEGAQSPLKERAEAHLAGIFRAGDYPTNALRKGEQGSASFALLIDERGRVADCTIVESSGVASLDHQSCGIIKERARFKPAVGPDGKPAKDAHEQTVRWKIR